MTLTRRYRFSASHRLHSPRLTDAENAALYGKCNNPFGHGHDYTLSVTVAGNPNSSSGALLPIPQLDRLVNEQILPVFAHRNLNADVPEFANRIPTTENLALVIADLLQEQWPFYLNGCDAQLHRVHIQETDRNAFEILLKPRRPMPDVPTRKSTLNA